MFAFACAMCGIVLAFACAMCDIALLTDPQCTCDILLAFATASNQAPNADVVGGG